MFSGFSAHFTGAHAPSPVTRPVADTILSGRVCAVKRAANPLLGTRINAKL